MEADRDVDLLPGLPFVVVGDGAAIWVCISCEAFASVIHKSAGIIGLRDRRFDGEVDVRLPRFPFAGGANSAAFVFVSASSGVEVGELRILTTASNCCEETSSDSCDDRRRVPSDLALTVETLSRAGEDFCFRDLDLLAAAIAVDGVLASMSWSAVGERSIRLLRPRRPLPRC